MTNWLERAVARVKHETGLWPPYMRATAEMPPISNVEWAKNVLRELTPAGRQEIMAWLDVQVVEPDYQRASGLCVCPCGKLYYDHPAHPNLRWLTVTCDGRIWKL